MSYEPPTPPTDFPDGIVDTLDDYSADHLRDVALATPRNWQNIVSAKHVLRRKIAKATPKNDLMISRMMSHRRRQSRSRKSTATATITGSGEKATESNQSTKDQSIRTSETATEYSTNDSIPPITHPTVQV